MFKQKTFFFQLTQPPTLLTPRSQLSSVNLHSTRESKEREWLGQLKKRFFFENLWARGVRASVELIILLGACRNSILGVFGIFLAKTIFPDF